MKLKLYYMHHCQITKFIQIIKLSSIKLNSITLSKLRKGNFDLTDINCSCFKPTHANYHKSGCLFDWVESELRCDALCNNCDIIENALYKCGYYDPYEL